MPASDRRRALVSAVGAGVGAGLLLLVLTWPVFRHPATRVLETESLYGAAGRLIQRDINLTMWILAWDTHALTTRPRDLFHANAFHPAPYALARSEHMLGNVPLFAPPYLLTGNPVFAHQWTLAWTFVLAAMAMAAWVHAWTRDSAAAVVAGIAYALAPIRLWQLGNLHVVSIHVLPLLLLAVDLVISGHTRRAAAAMLGTGLVLSSLCSYYVGYQSFLTVGVYAVARLVGTSRRDIGTLAALAGPTLLAALLVGAVTLPYLWLQRTELLPDFQQRGYDSLGFLAMLKFGLSGLLGAFVWPTRSGVPQFLTWTALVLAGVALLTARHQPRGALVLVGLTGVVLSLGPVLHLPGSGAPVPLPYALLAKTIPGFSAMRLPMRFGTLATLAIMALAGLGLARLRATAALGVRPVARRLLPLLVLAAFLGETAPGRLESHSLGRENAGLPAAIWLADHCEGGAVLNLPFEPNRLWRESVYMYHSIQHWCPTVNGYSPYPPPAYQQALAAADGLPAREALERLLAHTDPRWVVFHRTFTARAAWPEWEATLAAVLRPVGRFGDATVYERPSTSGPAATVRP